MNGIESAAAEDFIRKHHPRFGYSATHGLSCEAESPPQLINSFTREDHFKFGFNGSAFNFRKTPQCLFWTEYGKITRRPMDLRSELRAAIQDVFREHGRISISNSGSVWSESMIATISEMGIPFQQIIIDFDGAPPINPLCGNSIKRVSSSPDELFAFAEDYFKKTGSLAPEEAFSAFYGNFTDLPHIYEGGHNRLVNRSFDPYLGIETSAPYLVFGDSEGTLSINRYLQVEKKVGWPNLLKFTPELIAAQLCHPLSRNWIASFATAQEKNESTLPPEIREHPSCRRNNTQVEAEILRSACIPDSKVRMCHPALHYFPEWCKKILLRSSAIGAPPLNRAIFSMHTLQSLWGIESSYVQDASFYDDE